MATNLGKIGKMTFIWHAGIPKQVGIWQYCSYIDIICKYAQWSAIIKSETKHEGTKYVKKPTGNSGS